MKLKPVEFYEAARPVLESGRAVLLTIRGNSMYPFLKEGDTVRLRRRPFYRPGDIVLARDSFSDRVLLHYITGNTPDGYYKLMGAANLVQVEYCRYADVSGALECPFIDRRTVLVWDALRPLRRYILWLFRKFGV